MASMEKLFCLTEIALEQLIPVIGQRMKFFKALEKLQKNCPAGGNIVVQAVQEDQALAQAPLTRKMIVKQGTAMFVFIISDT